MKLGMLWKYRPSLITLGVVIWVLYIVLYLLAPVQTDKYHLSYAALFGIKLTIALPVLAIWTTALFGVRRFYRYAWLIRESPDGRALLGIATGLLVMVAGLISQTMLSAILPYFAGSTWVKLAVFMQNHVPIVFSFVGFLIILVGARRLARSANLRLPVEHAFAILLPYLILGAVFCWAFYDQFEVVVTDGVPNFSTSASMALWTIAFPSVITWLAGVLAVAHIYEYANHVSGKIYRKALRNLVRGIALSVALSVLLQLLSLGSNFFVHLGLGAILLVIYLLLVFYAAGFVFIARGAQALMQIEEAI